MSLIDNHLLQETFIQSRLCARQQVTVRYVEKKKKTFCRREVYNEDVLCQRDIWDEVYECVGQ